MKTLILLQPYGLLGKGDEMTVTAGVAELLIRRQIAREKKDGEKKDSKRSK